jgi:small GTP-binding protein
MPLIFTYDVFLSHSSADVTIVRNLATRLKEDGLRVWFDEWQILPGDLIGLKIEEGLEESRTLLLFMSSNSFASDWVTLERQTALFRDPTNAKRRFIPIRLDDCSIKDTLKQYLYIDWRSESDEGYAKLLSACRPPATAETILSAPIDVLGRHDAFVWGVAITPDGKRAASGSADTKIKVWDLTSKRAIATLKGHLGGVPAVSLTENGKLLVSGSHDRSVRLWDVDSQKQLAELWGHEAPILRVAVTPDGTRAVSASQDETIRIWDLVGRRLERTIDGHVGGAFDVAISSDGNIVLSASEDQLVRVWALRSNVSARSFKGHTDAVCGVAVTADGRRAISASADRTIRVWDLEANRCNFTMEGHTRRVYAVAMTMDGTRAVSASDDKTVRVWDLETGSCLLVIKGTCPTYSVTISSDGRRVVTGNDDGTLRVSDISPAETTAKVSRYTNAKVLLVGNTGVGKTGLALRLTADRFTPTISTDAAWATQLRLPAEVTMAGVEREIWLWDFGGQADYRLVHQLFMDETALAILVFNPQSEDPFDGLMEWDQALTRAARRRFSKLLVAARCDRGGLMVSMASIQRFCAERGFVHFLSTSALTGDGCGKLLECVVESIEWDGIPWTSSPRIFKLLKEAILQLRDEGAVLLRLSELKQQLEMRLSDNSFSVEELRAVIGLLAGPGAVWQLDFGDFLLLQPERINVYAAAVIRSVRAHTDEIGCISEELVLTGTLDYQDMARLRVPDEEIILRAMHQIFVTHGLCLREHTDRGSMLIFPSYFRRERPELAKHPSVLVTYQFKGDLDDTYATLVVRLHHTALFEKDELWRFAADFRTPEGKCVGLKMNKTVNGAAEIHVYCEPSVPDDTKVSFIRYIHDHLKAKDPDVVRVRHYICPHCRQLIDNLNAVKTRLARGLKDILCANCETRVPLLDLIEQKFASDDFQRRVREMEQQAQTSIDNESRELILLGHAYAVAGEAGQIFRMTPNSDWGIDGEIEFKDYAGRASGRRVYLQLKSGDSYLRRRERDGAEVFVVKNERHVEYWQAQGCPVMLVIRTSDGAIRWMDVSAYLRALGSVRKGISVQVIFDGQPFTALGVQRLRDQVLPRPDENTRK